MPESVNPNVTSYLIYDSSKELPIPAELEAFDPLDDFTLIPYDRQPVLGPADKTITLDMQMDNLGDGAN